ncbi:MAG: hypothetical protein JWM99_3353 [Verrucomicrobiales bacterium]|nr:hypothetical protein [Verrucomicrobiales bacterium]
MSKSTRLRLVGLAAIFGSIASIFLSISGFPLSFPSEPHRSIGKLMARKCLSLLGPGGQIHLIVRDTKAFEQPAADLQEEAFDREIRNSGSTIASVTRLQLNPLRPLEIPPGDLFQLIRKASPSSVIVSFMGAPFLPADQLRNLGPAHCKIVAFCPGEIYKQTNLKGLFEAGLLHSAVISKPPSRSLQPANRNFENLYRSIDSGNLADLPTREASAL